MILAGWLKSNCIFDVVIIYFSQQSGIDCVTEDLSQRRQDAVTIKFGQQSIEIVCVHHISHRLYVWLNDSESIAIILYSQLNLVNNQVNLSAFTVSPSVPASEHQLIWGGWQSGREEGARVGNDLVLLVDLLLYPCGSLGHSLEVCELVEIQMRYFILSALEKFMQTCHEKWQLQLYNDTGFF